MPRKQENWSHVAVRLPLAQKTFLEAEAARNGSSKNSEIIRAINARMEELAKDRADAAE
jgi:hypothetical protein